jgi:hypothetical protein
MNVERTKEMKIPTQPSPIQSTIEYKQAENLGYLKYFGSLITNDARSAHGIKSKIVMTKASTRRESFSPANWN